MTVLVKPFDFGDPLTVWNRQLPHWVQDGVAYFVTFRLADSLAGSVLREWDHVRMNWLNCHPPPRTVAAEREYRRRFSVPMHRHLDAGAGSCVLRRPECALKVAGALESGNGRAYSLGTWVVMPNHVHALIVPAPSVLLQDEVSAWKSISARQINRCLGRRGQLWARDAYDHIVRNARELARIDAYVRGNPEKARLPAGSFLQGGGINDWEFLPSPAR